MRYNRPRLIHQTHIKVILEAPKVKDGTGKELRRLHDEVQQHLRALRSMGYEPSGAIITSILELKLDPTTLFEWQRESKTSTSVPHFSELMQFIDLHAQASETSNPEKKQHRQDSTPRPHKLVPSYVAHTNPATKVCIAEKNTNCILAPNFEHYLMNRRYLSSQRPLASAERDHQSLHVTMSGVTSDIPCTYAGIDTVS